MRYRVTGNNEVLGHEPGEAFAADLDAVTEARLVSGGHIERAGPPANDLEGTPGRRKPSGVPSGLSEGPA